MMQRRKLRVLVLGACLSACATEDTEPNDEANDDAMAETETSTENGESEGDDQSDPDPCDGTCDEGQVCEDGTCAWPFDCDLSCTSFNPDGSCYCQTSCSGSVEIFTCYSSGECFCQSSAGQSQTIEGSCVSEEAAYGIYYRCFKA